MSKNLAEIKRLMKPGLVVKVVNHEYPELSGDRKLLRVQGDRWELQYPATHPKYKENNGSWLSIPKATEISIEGDSFSIAYKDGAWLSGHSGPFCTITIPKGNA